MTRWSSTTSEQRERMVERQIARRGIRDRAVLDAMLEVPRERFVEEGMEEFAYRDSALPIEDEQTISQPYIVAFMLDALELAPSHRVLEVGAGSGYAAAVLGRIAAEVFAIERHRRLARLAAARMEELGYDNVHVVHADGTLGLAAEAPFDRILVSAGGREVPRPLLEQLAPGGRLVMPVGEPGDQRIVVQEKDPEGAVSTERSLAVRFVPLLSGLGGAPAGPEPGAVPAPATPRPAPGAVDLVRQGAHPFDPDDTQALPARAVDRMAGHRVVLLGEASHGTSEFYAVRARLTRELVERGEVDFVAVEADWPDAAWLDRYVRGLDEAPAASPDGDARATRDSRGEGRDFVPFERFPRWMWANRETLEFLRWLREHNASIDDPDARVGFFGLDLYSLHRSLHAVLEYLDREVPDAAELARVRYGCLTPWEQDPQLYGRLVTQGRLEACEDQVVATLRDLLERTVEGDGRAAWRHLDAVQNARLVQNAERYYRAIFQGPSASWNQRDRHMFETLVDLLSFHGDDARAAVWAHNSHLGDASATEMGAGGQLNLGQLCRERWGEGCYAVGMGTHTGTVLAARAWGEPGEVREVRPSLAGSYERLGHDAEMPGFFLPLRRGTAELREELARERIERAIGVIYRPETERLSHYFSASLPHQFDEWIFVDRTRALEPLEGRRGDARPGDPSPATMDTYPFGV